MSPPTAKLKAARQSRSSTVHTKSHSDSARCRPSSTCPITPSLKEREGKRGGGDLEEVPEAVRRLLDAGESEGDGAGEGGGGGLFPQRLLLPWRERGRQAGLAKAEVSGRGDGEDGAEAQEEALPESGRWGRKVRGEGGVTRSWRGGRLP